MIWFTSGFTSAGQRANKTRHPPDEQLHSPGLGSLADALRTWATGQCRCCGARNGAGPARIPIAASAAGAASLHYPPLLSRPTFLPCCSALWPCWSCAGPSRAGARRPSRSAPVSTRDVAHTPLATSVAAPGRNRRSTDRRTRPRPIRQSQRCLVDLPLSITSFPPNSRLAPHRRRLARAKRQPRREDVRTPRMVHQFTLTDYRPRMNSML